MGKDAIEAFAQRHAHRYGCSSNNCDHKLPESSVQKKQLKETKFIMTRQHKMQDASNHHHHHHHQQQQQQQPARMSGKRYVLRTGSGNEIVYTGRSTLEGPGEVQQRRCALSWVGGGDVAGECAVWLFESAMAESGGEHANELVRIRNCHNNEFLYVGGSKLDEERRHVVTRVGGGEVNGNGAIWEIIHEGGGEDEEGVVVRLRNLMMQEWMYVGSNLLDENRRFVLTWIGGGDVRGSDGLFCLVEE